MKRVTIEPRPGWQQKVEKLGFMFHTSNGQPYWDESVYYEFTSAEVDAIEEATYRLNDMCLMAADYVIQNRRFANFGIPPVFQQLVVDSWDKEEITLYGRYDLAYDGTGPPKMLEYNADTPTSLLEAAVIQWNWLEEVFASKDQFNSIHERLIEAFGRVKVEVTGGSLMHFTSLNNWEDIMTTTYLRDCAVQAVLTTDFLFVKDVGWSERRHCFTDKLERPISTCFKLYPWEFMTREDFAPHLLRSQPVWWFEAPWKMVLSNKAILPVLWDLFPSSPYLLEASFEPMSGPHVRKPILSREGANVYLMDENGTVVQTDGPYGNEPCVYQRYQRLATNDGQSAVIGSRLVNGWACGMGLREDPSPITGNASRFVPHLF
jgi:glutathionylspermidine synthase